MATGISMALADTGKRIPQDFQVVGYDGIDDDSYNSLTTIQQDINAIAVKIAEQVLAAIQSSDPDGCWLDVILRQGKTTSCF